MRILLVEDNEFNRDMLSRRLTRRGHEVLMVATGESALAVAATDRPHVILMDVGLPGLDGLETTKLLKSKPDTANIPVVVLTAHAMQSDREKAKAAGCDEYETKPVDFQRLLAKIEAFAGELQL